MFLCLWHSSFSFSQDLEESFEKIKNIKEIDPFKVNGGLNISTVNYAATGIQPRRIPFAYALNANINFTLFEKISVPFAVNYTNGEGSFTGNNAIRDYINSILSRTGASPSYKGYTLHLGERALNFSKYTYSGVRFFGIGAEVKPENSIVGIAVWKGRLSKRFLPDTLGQVPTPPTLERNGYGIKLDVGKQKQQFSFILFSAEDQFEKRDTTFSRFDLKPQSNLVIGVNTKNKITQKLDFNFEWAGSAFTDDMRAPESINEYNPSYFNNLGNIFSPLTSTRYNNVINTGLKYKGGIYTLGATFLRVDPTFRSLGSVSIRNDVQAYKLDGSLSLLQGKVNLTGNFGVEQNNLDQNLALNMLRVIWGTNLSWMVTQNLMLSGDYSNFNHSTEPSLINVADTIRLIQINHNQNFNAIYSFGKSINHSFMANAAIQLVNDIQEFEGVSAEDIKQSNSVNNYLLSYTLSIKALDLSGTLSGIHTQISGPTLNATTTGPSLAISKKFMDKKIVAKYTAAVLNNTLPTGQQLTLNNKIGIAYKVNDHHSFKVDFLQTYANMKGDTPQEFAEYQGKLNYAYTF